MTFSHFGNRIEFDQTKKHEFTHIVDILSMVTILIVLVRVTDSLQKERHHVTLALDVDCAAAAQPVASCGQNVVHLLRHLYNSHPITYHVADYCS